jgi:hypothetical protein
VSEGEYTFEWFGYVDESPSEVLLASGTFRVNNHLQIFCDGDEIPEVEPPTQQPSGPRVRLASSPVATPASHKTTMSGFAGQPPRDVNVPARWRFFIGEGPGGIDLSCRKWQTEVPVSIACVVEDPNGVKLAGQIRHVGDDLVRSTYPTDFGAQPMSGLHFVQWLVARRYLFGEDVSDPNGTVGIIDPIEFTIEVSGH